MAFDKTYLLKAFNVCTFRQKKILVGGAFKFGVEDVSLLFLDQDVELANKEKAAEMLECLTWLISTDMECQTFAKVPRKMSRFCFSLAEIPMSQKCSASEMLAVLGTLLLNSPCVRILTFDNHMSHVGVKLALLGCPDASVTPDVPFFGELFYQDLPAHPLSLSFLFNIHMSVYRCIEMMSFVIFLYLFLPYPNMEKPFGYSDKIF